MPFDEKRITITAAALAALQPVECQIGIIGRVECFHHGLTARADPPPIANERGASEQRRLYRKAVEPPHILCRVHAPEVNGIEIAHGFRVSLPAEATSNEFLESLDTDRFMELMLARDRTRLLRPLNKLRIGGSVS